jgi:predicted nucleotidyltransferase
LKPRPTVVEVNYERRYTGVIMRLETLRDVVGEFSQVRLAYLFGSVAAGTARDTSDVDIAVLLAPGADPETLDRLIAALESVSARTVDLVDLAAAPPLLAHEIIKNGKLILSRDEDERVAFVTRAIASYLDTAHLRKVQHHYLRERVEARDGR